MLETEERIPSVPGDTLLYKYRSLATPEFVADILLRHRLFCADPRNFNDPFDCGAPISFDATAEKKIECAVVQIRKKHPAITEEAARVLAPARCIEVEANAPGRIRARVENQGVVSLAGVLDNLLLWANYADSHKGVCITFGASHFDHGKFFGQALQVRYNTKRPVVNFYLDSPEVQVSKHLLTKSRDWEYEREWRIIVNNRQCNRYWEFDPKLISAVYLGCRISPEDQSRVEQWLHERDCPSMPRLFKATCSSATYGLEFEQITY
jgi:hypothetical protein